LIAEGYLKDGSPESYYGYFLELQKNNEYPEIPPVLFKDALEIVGVESVEGFDKCTFLLEGGEDPIAEKFESAEEKIKNARDISPRFMATVWLEVYKPEDFTMDFYKVSFFETMFPSAYFEAGISMKLPPIEDMPPPPPPPLPVNIIDLKINDNDDLFINGKQAEIKGLKEKVKDFLLKGAQQEEIEIDGLGKQSKTLGAIYLTNGRGTSYNFYIKVQNEVIAAYAELRDERSQELFGKSYRNLSKEEGKVIKTLIPQRLFEFEPSRN
jgi:biopolymer transport protein ExbD